ncbi:sensor histidine kinase [Yinghuangia seranimata]|uniref:sensor histidine kinase n=1 Tax=Yinghuangia seranimata TaxID=408067 RepID=UPI00248C00CE|nr:sensor histidine kinase [Yinghuangia seranimata]MDI2130431.1 sensor histidine kinase [Yinghuangia seranimata]
MNGKGIGARIRAGGVDAVRGLALVPSMVLGLVLFCLTVTFLPLMIIGIGVLVVPVLVSATRGLANHARRRSEAWTGVRIAEPYRPRPHFDSGIPGVVQRLRWMLTDPATWRDLLWTLADLAVGLALAIMALGFIAEGVFGMLQPFLWKPITEAGDSGWYTFLKVDSDSRAVMAVFLGMAYVVVGFAIAPAMLKAHALFTRSLLAPTKKAEMLLRVAHLTDTRSAAVDASAAELRRIERDLHDGAQARLVAMGMNLGAAESLMESNPEAARQLLSETREASAKALHELRDLVRGIHPPVLADRGLGDAVRAIALESPLNVEVTVALSGRPPAPVESAAYFAVMEVLTNAAKHSGARNVWVDLRYRAGRLHIDVIDDGRGGASLNKGTGLRGIERRLGTFDGTLALDSPEGGPTTVTMELPCELSSPKTSPS